MRVSCALDLHPIVVRHFRGFTAGLGLVDEGIHALLPIGIHRDRLPNSVAEAQKQFGSLLKEFFPTGEFTALNGRIDAFLRSAGSATSIRQFSLLDFTPGGCPFSPLILLTPSWSAISFQLK